MTWIKVFILYELEKAPVGPEPRMAKVVHGGSVISHVMYIL